MYIIMAILCIVIMQNVINDFGVDCTNIAGTLSKYMAGYIIILVWNERGV